VSAASPYWDTLAVASVVTIVAAEVITASTLPQQPGLSSRTFSCLVSFSLLASDNVLGPPSMGTDRVRTLSVPMDGDLNTLSDVKRLETSEAREVRGLRLRNFRLIFA
jgi:hypothetical protein